MKLFSLPFLIALVALCLAEPAQAACTNCTITSATLTASGGALSFAATTDPAANPAADHARFFVDGQLVSTKNSPPFTVPTAGAIGPGKHAFFVTVTFGPFGGTQTDVSSTVQNPIVTDDVVGPGCAIESGGVVTWGYDGTGQIGNGLNTPNTFYTSPVSINIGGNAKSISCATYSHMCAVRTDGTIQCWGDNSAGEIGDNTTTQRLSPTAVSGASGATQVSVGNYFSCGTFSGAAKCWGYNGSGQLGDGTTVDRHVPTQVSGLTSGVVMVTAGAANACALLSSGAIKCWGDNAYGQIGDGTTTSRLTPTATTITNGASYVSAGIGYACGVYLDHPYCWGYNVGGNIGNGNTTSMTTPTLVSTIGSTATLSIKASAFLSTCATTTAGKGYCWGFDTGGESGDGVTPGAAPYLNLTPQAVASPFGSGTIEIATGGFVTVGWNGAHVYSWGENNNGQLGQGGAVDSNAHPTPALVHGL